MATTVNIHEAKTHLSRLSEVGLKAESESSSPTQVNRSRNSAR